MRRFFGKQRKRLRRPFKGKRNRRKRLKKSFGVKRKAPEEIEKVFRSKEIRGGTVPGGRIRDGGDDESRNRRI